MNKVDISKAVADENRKMEELFEKKPVPECMSIVTTIESLEQIPIDKRYPNLTSKYPELGKYCGKTIYIFSVTNFPYDLDEMAKYRKKAVAEKNVSLFRINETSPKWKNVKSDKTVCLYVGSSKDIHERLKEHLFLCNPKANAMHLETWFPKKQLITISIWDFEAFLKDENPEYLQNIEDLLWNHYKPLLGKQGRR